jgi:arsenate reductase
MPVKIYHNPRCSKSRQTLEILKSSSISPQIIEYLKTPLTKDDILSLMNQLEIEDPKIIMRKKEPQFKELLLDQKDSDQDKDELIKSIEEHPILLERPIVVTEKGARVCRPPELVHEIL